jgi:ribose transport system permease protein
MSEEGIQSELPPGDKAIVPALPEGKGVGNPPTPPATPPGGATLGRLLAAFGGGSAKKLIGICLFLLILYVILLFADPNAASAANHFNLAKRIGLYGIISLGAGLLIISGGIDLSIGAVVALSGTLLAVLLDGYGWSPAAAIPFVLLVGSAIGLGYGLLVTRLRVQPFVATLCGLFVYRGLARWLANDQQRGLGTAFPGWKYALAGNDLDIGRVFRRLVPHAGEFGVALAKRPVF